MFKHRIRIKSYKETDLAMTEYTCLLPHSSKIKYKMSVSGRSRA